MTTRQQVGDEASGLLDKLDSSIKYPSCPPEDETTLPAKDTKCACGGTIEAVRSVHSPDECVNMDHYVLRISSEAERDALKAEVEKHKGLRVHTQEWYASHYGKLRDWARKVLPEPYRNQFFSCIANGTYDGMLDVGEPYMCKAGFMVTPSGYMHMDDAKGQLVIDQTRRAEEAEAELSTLKAQLDAVGQESPQEAFERGWLAGTSAAAEDIETESDADIELIMSSVRGNILSLQVPPYTPGQ